jgi:hypothetical protein
MFPGLARYQSGVKQAMREGGDAAARAQANQMIGASIFASGMMLAAGGRLTGRGPLSPALRKQMLDNGQEPYTLIAPWGETVNLDRLEPFGKIAELGADAEQGTEAIAQRMKDRKQYADEAGENKHVYLAKHPVFQSFRQIADFWDATRGTFSEDGAQGMAALTASLAQKATSDEWFSSVSTFLDIIQGGSAEAPAQLRRYLTQEAASVAPGSTFWSGVNQDPVHRETRGIIESLRSKAQGFSNQLEPHRNNFGEEVMLPPGFVDWLPGNHINPFITGNISGRDSLQTQLLAMGKALPEPKTVTKGIGGLPDVDWTERSYDSAKTGGLGQSPYDRAKELLSTPMFKGKTARQVYQDILDKPQMKKVPTGNPLYTEGPRYNAISLAAHELWQAAAATMLSEPRYHAFAMKVLTTKATATAGKEGGQAIAHSVYQKMMDSLNKGSVAPTGADILDFNP